MDTSKADRLVAEMAAAGRSALSEVESKEVLAALGVPVAASAVARSADEAAELAARCGFPAVLKVLSPDAAHKSEVAGVALGLRSADEVKAAFARIRQNLAAARPDARFDGVSVQAMAPAGVELIVGVTRDERYGPLVVAGLGGVFVEVLKDTALRLAPVSAAGARAMLDELRAAALLRGARGGAPVDLGALAELIASVSEFAARAAEVREMDLNPVAAYADGLRVLDARILLDAGAAKPAAPADPRHARRVENLRRAFDARAVAVIGDKRVGGYLWLRAMARFSRKLYSIQIDPSEIPGIEAMGVANYKSLAELPEPVDYAVSAVPRQVAPRILRDCVAAGVAGIGFFTSGFSETGEELGVKLERELRATAAESDIALVGPNCMGLYNPAIGLCNFPDQEVGTQGDVCFISQSGTHCINFCSQAPTRGIRINKAASIGNVLMLEAADFIDLMADDPATRALGMYIEGVRDGRRFFESLRRAAARVPVVVWKGGMTEAGARATFSHTGSLATPAAVWRALVEQGGAVSVASLDEMLDAMELFARGRRVAGRRMGLVAMTGGQSVVITDTFAAVGLEVPALSEASYAELKGFFNTIGGSYRNPLDAGGTIGMGHHQGNLDRILDILDRDPVIDATVLEIGTGLRAARWAAHEDELTALLDKLAEFNARSRKAFAVILHPAHVATIVVRAKELARSRGLVVFDSFERAAAAFSAAAHYWERRANA
ncbi:MAG TPA: acetate--CoA ligase family protein [Candidatus Binataceae bacterium]|nr:acetate--CoA ligase family protein [Candidatus Binataceae bacterium]